MTPTNQICPICHAAFEKETRLTVHLEVEHRKSELATRLVEGCDDSSVPVTDPAEDDETRSNTRPTPPM